MINDWYLSNAFHNCIGEGMSAYFQHCKRIGKYPAKWEFPVGWGEVGGREKNPFMREVSIFYELHISSKEFTN